MSGQEQARLLSGDVRDEPLTAHDLMRSRAYRRHHLARMKCRVAGYYGGYARHNPRDRGRLARTRTPCSCAMCGNPRRRSGKATLQERRAAAGAA